MIQTSENDKKIVDAEFEETIETPTVIKPIEKTLDGVNSSLDFIEKCKKSVQTKIIPKAKEAFSKLENLGIVKYNEKREIPKR